MSLNMSVYANYCFQGKKKKEKGKQKSAEIHLASIILFYRI